MITYTYKYIANNLVSRFGIVSSVFELQRLNLLRKSPVHIAQGSATMNSDAGEAKVPSIHTRSGMCRWYRINASIYVILP